MRRKKGPQVLSSRKSSYQIKVTRLLVQSNDAA
jgi:hypothetical protein